MRVRKVLWRGGFGTHEWNPGFEHHRVVSLVGGEVVVQYHDIDGKWELEDDSWLCVELLGYLFKDTLKEYNKLLKAYEFEHSLPGEKT